MGTVSPLINELGGAPERLRVIALGRSQSAVRAASAALAAMSSIQVVYDDEPIATDREAALLPRYHVALTDIDAGPTSSGAVIKILSNTHPDRPVIGITHTSLLEPIWHAVNAGASGVIHQRDFDPARFPESLAGGGRANAFLSPTVARILLDQVRSGSIGEPAALAEPPAASQDSNPQTAQPEASLSPRECEILKLSASGHIGKEIARILSVSPHTVTTHFKNIYRKLEVTTRGEAVFRAYKAGLI